MRPPRKILEYHYITKCKTMQEIGNIYGVSRQCVLQWIDYYGLPRRKNNRNKSIVTKSQFKKYIDSGYSIHKISTIINTDQSILWGLLYDYDLYDYYIETPFSERWVKDITKEELQQLYDNNNVNELMKKMNCHNQEKFYEILNKYDIKRKYNTKIKPPIN